MTLPSTTLDTIFSALADPTRRAILGMLLEDDMAVTDVAAPFPVSLAAISKHLAVLAAAGLILQERRGRIIWGIWRRTVSRMTSARCRQRMASGSTIQAPTGSSTAPSTPAAGWRWWHCAG